MVGYLLVPCQTSRSLDKGAVKWDLKLQWKWTEVNSNPQQKRTRGDSNPRPSAPEALALSMLCNETIMYKKSPLNVGFYIYAVDSDFAT